MKQSSGRSERPRKKSKSKVRPERSAKSRSRPKPSGETWSSSPSSEGRASKSERILLFGRRPVQAYLDVLENNPKDDASSSRPDVESISLSESFPSKFRDELLRKLPTVRFEEMPRRQLDQQFPDLHHQGVVLSFRPGTRPESQSDHLDWREFVRDRQGLLLLLDRIQDPQNLGSILRSAEALGARAVFLTGQGAPLNDTAHRVSSGASLRLPVFQQTNLHQLVEYLKECEYWICSAADPAAAIESRPGKQPLTRTHNQPDDLPPANELVLVIGNEGDGVKQLVIQESDYILSIPLRGQTESLNAGVAAGILIDRLINR